MLEFVDIFVNISTGTLFQRKQSIRVKSLLIRCALRDGWIQASLRDDIEGTDTSEVELLWSVLKFRWRQIPSLDREFRSRRSQQRYMACRHFNVCARGIDPFPEQLEYAVA